MHRIMLSVQQLSQQEETSCFTFYKEGGGIVFRLGQEG